MLGIGGGAGCLCPVYDPALEGSCPVSSEGATTKVQEMVGKEANDPQQSVADCAASGWVFPRGLEGQCCCPSLPSTAGSLPASPMPYAWAHCHKICNTCGSHAHMPTSPPQAAPGPQRLQLPQPPFSPSCLPVFTLRMAPNKCCPWRPDSGSATSVIVYPWWCQGVTFAPPCL